MKVLGISAWYHDAAAALVDDGHIVAAAQEERFTRKKHDPSFPRHAIRYCLEEAGLEIGDLDAVVFYDKPLLKFERLLETYYAFSPRGIRSFLTAMPIWIKEKLFMKDMLRKELAAIGKIDRTRTKILFSEHHLSHAASAYYPSGYEDSAILTIDGVGEWTTASIAHGKGAEIVMKKELLFPHSVGLLYSAFTQYLGFKVNSGEYKLMGLAPYGDPGSPDVTRFKDIIKTKIVRIYDDGSVWLDQSYFDYATGLRMTNVGRWSALFGFPPRGSDADLQSVHCNLALAIQQVTEEIVLKMAREAKRLTGSKHLCLAGGVALNCVANGRVLRDGIFEGIFIQPAAGDAGGALGAALAATYLVFGIPRDVVMQGDSMQGAYLGPEFSERDIERMAKRAGAMSTRFTSFDELAESTARHIADGAVVGWFQGRMEFGPRALGNRSILGDPRNAEMQKKLNLKIKYREGFRPFAPSVMMEHVGDYFDLRVPSPYMLLVAPVQERRRHALPEGYHEWSLKEKLYFLRSDIPSVTHIDFSARVQTVHRETNERYWKLIDAFRRLTGYAVIVNTSFNVRGEPIVCTPEDAYRCFMRTEMDFLVMGSFLFDKKQQPAVRDDAAWKEEFVLD